MLFDVKKDVNVLRLASIVNNIREYGIEDAYILTIYHLIL